MSWSRWKGHYIDLGLFWKSSNFRKNRIKKIWCRNSTIPSTFLNWYVLIHTGKDFIKILITKEKIGFKFGEFCFTWKWVTRFKVKNKNKK